MTTVRIVTVRYERLKNMGNYENEKVCLEATVEADQSAQEVYAQLRAEADVMLNGPMDPPGQLGSLW